MENSKALSQFTIGEIELSYRKKIKTPFQKITNSQTANECIRKVFPVTQINYREHFYVVYLNNSNEILGYQLISVGGITATMVDIRIVFQGALLAHATAIILCHNHPSGSVKVSRPDKELTEKIQAAGELLDIKILDHIIITENNYYSFADDGNL